jgi:hypothetical protein
MPNADDLLRVCQMTFQDPAPGDEAGRIRKQLKAIEHERIRLEARLCEIEHGNAQLKALHSRPGRDQQFGRG